MNTKKKDINLLVAAGIKKGIDFKASAGLVMLVVFVIAVGVMSFMYISAITNKNSLEEKINSYNQLINNPSTALKLQQLKEKQAKNDEIKNAAQSGNDLLDYVGGCKSIYTKLPETEIVKIKMRAAGVDANFISLTYKDNSIFITFDVNPSMSGEIPNISVNCINAITDIYKSGTVFKPFTDNKFTLVQDEQGTILENTFVITAKMQNYYDLVRIFDGIDIKKFSFSATEIRFDGVAGAASSDLTAKKAARDRIDSYAMLLKNNGKPVFFSSVTATGQGSSSAPAESEGKNPNGVDFTYYTYSFVCKL